MTISKRDFLWAFASGLAAASTSRIAAAADKPVAADNAAAHAAAGHDMAGMPAHWHGSEEIAFLIYPEFTALDVFGPHYMLASLMGAKVHFVAKTREPVASDFKVAVVPTATFEECPKDLDILCVPGGSGGTLAAMRDEATIAFLKDRGGRAKLVTSVCTGSLLLGAAGLLEGYRATSHWLARELLRDFGAEPIDQRVVVDRNRITGAGVTAGIDFGLSIVKQLRDEDYAKTVQLLAEYQPEPPLDAGTPGRAGPSTTKLVSDMFVPFMDEVRNIARRRPR